MTSKTEQAKQLLAIALNENRRATERLEALLAANLLRKDLKVGWVKFDITNEAATTLSAELRALVEKERADEAEVDTEFELPAEVAAKYQSPFVERPEGFEASEDELAEQALRPKHEEHDHQNDFVPPTVVSEPEPDASEPKPSEEPQKLTSAERGAIGVMARDLLQTSMSYEDIAIAIRERYPHAKTTARSLASVAADMRRDGIPCPSRRKAK